MARHGGHGGSRYSLSPTATGGAAGETSCHAAPRQPGPTARVAPSGSRRSGVVMKTARHRRHSPALWTASSTAATGPTPSIAARAPWCATSERLVRCTLRRSARQVRGAANGKRYSTRKISGGSTSRLIAGCLAVRWSRRRRRTSICRVRGRCAGRGRSRRRGVSRGGAATGRKASVSAVSRTAREGRWHGARGRRIYGRNRVE